MSFTKKTERPETLKAEPVTASGKAKAIEGMMAGLDKKYGRGSVMLLGEERAEKIDVIPTGSLALDIALGVGGIPCGRIIEVYGNESCGKTTLAYHIMAQAMAKFPSADERFGFIDAEHAVDKEYAERLGVDPKRCLFSQPDNGEEGLEICEAFVRAGLPFIVVDSVAALVPRAEIEGEMGDSHPGMQARLMSQGLRKLGGLVKQQNVTVLFINQIREKIGVMFGNPETTPGGKALKFWASARIEVRKGEVIKDKATTPIGIRCKYNVVKNKVAPPLRKGESDLMFGTGFSRGGELVDLGVVCGLVEKSGTYFTYGGNTLGQGRDNARLAVEADPELAFSLEQGVRQRLLKVKED